MTEIIHPKFDRKYRQKVRMLRTKPELSEHPEFKDVDTSVPVLTIFTLAFFWWILIFRR